MNCTQGIILSAAGGWWLMALFASTWDGEAVWHTWLAFMVVGIFGLLTAILAVLVRDRQG